MAKTKKTKKQETLPSGASETTLTLELVGGVFAVETFPDGKQLRTEIDGVNVLEIMLRSLEHGLDTLDWPMADESVADRAKCTDWAKEKPKRKGKR